MILQLWLHQTSQLSLCLHEERLPDELEVHVVSQVHIMSQVLFTCRGHLFFCQASSHV